MKLVTNIGFIKLKNLEISNKNIKRLRYATTTKNLFDLSLLTGFYASIGGYQYKNIQLKPNTTYAISTTNSNYFNNVAGTKPYAKLITEDNNELLFIGHQINPALSIYPDHSETFTTDSTGKIGLAFNCPPFTEDAYKQFYEEWFANMQIEEGTTATSYVPYGCLDLGIIPSNSGYILNKYNNLSEELLEENVEKDTINYHIPNKTNILLNKVEGKTNKIVQLLDKSTVNCSSVNDWIGGTGSDTNLRVANGVVSIDGTLGSYSGVRTQDNKPIIKGHKYYISTWAMCSKNASNVLLPYIYGFSSSTSTLTANEWKNAEIIDTANVSDTTSIGVRYGSGESSEETVVWSAKKPQFFDLTAMYGFGNEPTTVEQFKKDYPQFFDEKLDGIWNVKTSGISTTGKNLLDIDSVSFFTKVSNGEYKSNTYIGIYPNYILWTPVDGTKQVTISGYIKCPVDKNYRFSVLYEDGTEASSYISSTGDYLYNSYTSDSSKKIKYVYLHYTNDSNEVYIKDVQIEEGSTATDYEPYTENKIDLLSTQTLNGINGVNDYIEVIDKGNGLYDLKKTKNIDSVDLGTLDWAVDGPNFYSGSISSVIKPPANDNSVGNYTCQKYVNVALSKNFVDGDFGSNSSGLVYFRNSAYTTAAAFKTAMNGVILYYQLKTPVITTIATNLTYNQVSAIRTNGGLLLVNDNNNQKYAQPNVTVKGNYQYKS